MEDVIRQIAALPYRAEDDGSVRVMLITSRETRRWVIPKGNPIKGLRPHEAAAHEAYEEAGVMGIPCPTGLGSYRYAKRRKDGSYRMMDVEVYPLAFVEQLDEWPEQEERDTAWFTPAAAADAVDEHELKDILRNFQEPPPPPAFTERIGPAVRDWTGERFPLLRWFQNLMPSEPRFFDLFEAHSVTLVAAAEALALLLRSEDGRETHVREIILREHEADDITRDVLHLVRRSFITPFDRSAITGLIAVMDDAIDQMNALARTSARYAITEYDQFMRDMGGIIVEAARLTDEALPLLRSLGRNAGRLHGLTERLIRLEGHADEIYDAGLTNLFKTYGADDPMGFMIRREIYAHLEKIIDSFEDVANEIQGIVIDHA